MSRTRKIFSDVSETKNLRPTLTPEARESRMISLTMDLVEQRLLDGTATSQETTHFLKLASSNYRLEQEKLMNENALLKAKVNNLESQANAEKLYAEALEAMRSYKGENLSDDE